MPGGVIWRTIGIAAGEDGVDFIETFVKMGGICATGSSSTTTRLPSGKSTGSVGRKTPGIRV